MVRFDGRKTLKGPGLSVMVDPQIGEVGIEFIASAGQTNVFPSRQGL